MKDAKTDPAASEVPNGSENGDDECAKLRAELASARAAERALSEKFAKLEAAKALLEHWVSDLQAGKYINCVYCGHRYPPGTPGVMADVLYEHIKQCPKHPLSRALAAINYALEALETRFLMI